MRAQWICRFVFGVGLALTMVSLCQAQGDAQKLFFDGFELLKAGKAKEAMARFEQGLTTEPNNAPARFYLGEAYLATGQKDKAKEQLRRSLELDANSPVAEDARKRLGELSGNAFAASGNAAGANVPAAGTVIQDCSTCPEMVVVPAGQFVMGSPPSELGRDDDEGPPHLVTIAKPFAVGKYEVTFDEWDACVAARACARADDSGFGRGRRPVINVNYERATGYAEWLAEKTGKKYRLLSEAEWEYATRGGSDKSRFWGSSADRACGFANVNDQTSLRVNKFDWESFPCDDGYAKTAPVGTFKPNAFGLYDMMGNVWEWVEDCYNKTYEGAPTNGSAWGMGDCSLRVNRGGSWSFFPSLVRSARRNGFQPSKRNNNLGFRVARTLP